MPSFEIWASYNFMSMPDSLMRLCIWSLQFGSLVSAYKNQPPPAPEKNSINELFLEKKLVQL